MSSTSDNTIQFFESSVAPAFIIGASIFGIFWGVVNALLVSFNPYSKGHRHIKNFWL